MTPPSARWSQWRARRRPARAGAPGPNRSRAQLPASAPLAPRHQQVQRLRRLLGRRSARLAEGAFVIEGTKLLSEALAAGAPVESVYVTEGTSDPVVAAAVDAGVRVYDVAAGVVERVADAATPQPILA